MEGIGARHIDQSQSPGSAPTPATVVSSQIHGSTLTAGRDLTLNVSGPFVFQDIRGMLGMTTVVDEARYNSSYSATMMRRGCTVETRKQVLEDLKTWVMNPKGEKVYWMNGMAGTGKTTITYSFCEVLEKEKRLGSNYFCSRSSALCRNVNNIIPTLVYQLAQYSPAFRTRLRQVLEANPESSKLDITWQFRKLLQEPIQALKMYDNIVIVIDALDECDNDPAFRSFLKTLLENAPKLPVRFFLTSRPEPEIIRTILAPRYSPSVLRLHDIEESIVKADIKKYLTEELEFIYPPPSENDVECLTNRAGKLFIYAATAVRYILVPRGVPHSRLQTVLGFGSTASKNQHVELDTLYTDILSAAMNPKELEENEIDIVRLTLNTVICAKESLTIQNLASLLHLSPDDILSVLQSLQSVIHVQEGEEGLIAPFHASFTDYLTDIARSGKFHCDSTEHNALMAKLCFKLMKVQLRFNICRLESSFVFDEDVRDLQDRIKRYIPPALSYACRYWGEHLRQGCFSESNIEELVDFLNNRLLFWMEVLNLKRCLGPAAGTLRGLQSWLKTSDIRTQKQIADTGAFITRFVGGACSRSTPHIYISALAFCPKSNSVYANYWGRTRGLIDVRGSAMERWPSAAVAIWETNSPVHSVAFSPDGTRVVSGSEHNFIRIWDAYTGATVAGPFKGHTGSINSVAFSPDGTTIASGSSDNTIRIWDVHTGDTIAGPFEGHTGQIYSVAFSPDGKSIGSGSGDKTIRVWDVHTGDTVAGPFKGHTGWIYSVAFSPDGTTIVSGSGDKTICVWDIHTGDTIAGPFKGHTGQINSVALSSDGTTVASGSSDKTMRVWDIHTGDTIAGPFKGHTRQINSVAFSPDGTTIVSGSDDSTIRIWDIHTGLTVAGPFKGHIYWINSVAFSPKGTTIVSGSRDNTIRIWDVHTSDTIAGPFEEHTSQINSVAFSPNGTTILSGSGDKTICVWDIHTGDTIAGPFKGHTGQINSVAFSPDGTTIASGSDDNTMRVWDIHTGDTIAGPFEGHTRQINSVAFSPDGTTIASGSTDKTIRVWDVHTGDTIAGPFKGHTDSINSVAFSPDGTTIVSGSGDKSIRVWDVYNGDTIAGPFEGHTDWIFSVAFSPDGTTIVSGSDDKTIRLWDVHTGGTTAGPFKGHTSQINSVAFSPDGTTIVSGSDDNTIRIWDVHTGDTVAGPFKGHTDYINSVAFSPDGTTVVSGSFNKTIRVWDICTGKSCSPPLQHNPLHCNTIFDGFTYSSDGWVTTQKGPIFWISPAFRPQLPYPPGTGLAIGPPGATSIDYRLPIFIGKKWSSCYRVD